MSNQLDAAFELAKEGQFDNLPELLAQWLKDEDPDIRAEAAHRVGWIGLSATIPLLGEAVEDEEQEVRHDAIFALLETARLSAVNELAKGLLHSDEETREDARVALNSLLGEDAAEATNYMLDPEEEYALFNQWWQKTHSQFDPELCYIGGKVTDVREWIEILRSAEAPVAEWYHERLHYWTGYEPPSHSATARQAAWERWLRENGQRFEAGKRYFYGHPVR